MSHTDMATAEAINYEFIIIVLTRNITTLSKKNAFNVVFKYIPN